MFVRAGLIGLLGTNTFSDRLMFTYCISMLVPLPCTRVPLGT